MGITLLQDSIELDKIYEVTYSKSIGYRESNLPVFLEPTAKFTAELKNAGNGYFYFTNEAGLYMIRQDQVVLMIPHNTKS